MEKVIFEKLSYNDWVGKFVHYEGEVAKILSYDSEQDRYFCASNVSQNEKPEKFFVKGDNLRKLSIEEK